MTANVRRGRRGPGAALAPAGLVLAGTLTAGCSGGAGVADVTSGRVVLRACDQMSFDPMSWRQYGRGTDDDLRALYRYLRSLP